MRECGRPSRSRLPPDRPMSAISPASSALIDERVPWLDEEMEATLASASRDLDLYRWARYHLGWLDESLRPLSPSDRRKHGGKRLRGVLTILAAEAVSGGSAGRAAAPAGAAIEFVHNFSLLHDDIEDADEERRHRPTVWKLWGIPHAINAGSNMQAMVDAALFRLTAASDAETALRALHAVSRAILLMTEGQYLDMAAQDAAEMTLESYFRMTGGKTAALIEAALRVGAQVGGGSEPQIESLAAFGRAFGLAFQCRDDYLGIWGAPERTGKPVGSDILQGKRSLPVVHALSVLRAGSSSGTALRRALQARDISAVLGWMDEAGTRDFVDARVAEHTSAALAALEGAAVDGPHARAIREIADFALSRDS
jgi:geranylgeranyl diphosphate synthase type I